MEEPIRILQIVTKMNYGGIENMLMTYFRNIDRKKVVFDFLSHYEGKQDFEEEITALGGNLYKLPRLNPFSMSYYKRLEKFFKEHPEYRVVHSHLDCMAGIPLIVAKKCGVKVRIAHSHSSNQNYNFKYPIKLMCKKIIPKIATALFACSKQAGNWMFNTSSYKVLCNAINSLSFRYSPDMEKEVKDILKLQKRFVVGHVGQFRKEKNHFFLLDIFAEVLKKDSSSVLVMVGEGDQMEPAKTYAEELGITSNVMFLGARNDVNKLLQGFDIFVLPSKFEGLPVSVIEAQAAGLPCVVTDCVPQECCDVTGNAVRLSIKEKPAVWAEKILSYKGFNKQDAYEQIKNAGFDIKENARWLEEYYINAYNKK